MTINKKEYKLDLFADNLILYSAKYDKTIPKLLNLISEFSQVSGYKINIDQTEIMHLTETIKQIPDSLKGFKWTKKGFKYLGCNIRT